MTAERAPGGLGRRGRRLWHAVLADYELGNHERELLIEACRTADAIERIDAELAKAPVVVDGSRGQLTAHPLLGELRQQRDLLGRLLTRLALPGEDAESAAVTLGHRGAAARWHRRKGS